MKTKQQTFIISLIFIFIFSVSIFINTAFAAPPAQVVIIPFEINAENDLEFLKTGIQDMLNSRLSWKDKVVVVDKAAVNDTIKGLGKFKGESLALLAGGKLKADYIISGSITVIGQSASIDATLRDITGQIDPITFFGQSNSLGGVIPEINRFATTVNEQVFQRQLDYNFSGTPQTLPSPPRSSNSINKSTAPNPIFKTAASSNNKSTLNPNFKTTGSPDSSTGFWKTPPLPLLAIGMDVGDVNNDGIVETVILTNKTIIIYQMLNNRMVKTTQIPTAKFSHPLGIDIGDINNNGTPEIFISSLNSDRNRANSYILEFNGKSYPAVKTGIPWYYRISKETSGKPLLLGQEQRKKKADILTAPVYEMQYHNGNYVPHNIILRGKTANVLGVAIKKDNQNKHFSTAAFDTIEHLSLFTESGTLLWRNREASGGTMSMFFLPKAHADDDQDIQFFPLRIRIHDMNGDGNIEILSATNHDKTMGILSNSKAYDWGVLESYSWKGTDMISNWKTSPLPGRISDFLVADFDNDGIDELVVATVTEEGDTVISKSKSRLVAYDLIVSQDN
ncbi:Repeat domain-containing protein [Desulfocicer vacuolatum DSM 3385]|uniref:Repeat domain-containing protein n=1 Tax=Desulfocicer vacuolatum DSM 3385 TaxID=1121400 RepID=A0A1W2C2Z9_9BACT|nr:VCBS repeat-containing protein [Desulfocicer vacuolatum]SMC79617.1 Repeat domain-containing protein [Desulfocicer vacuolatum DSM 3385]